MKTPRPGIRVAGVTSSMRPQAAADDLKTTKAASRGQGLDQDALAARHEAILAEIPDIVMEVDAHKVYTWANAVGLEFFGEDVIGKGAADYFVGEQDTYQEVQPLFAGDRATFYVESWQRRKDGQERLLAWWCRALVDSAGRVTGALSTARDITERKRAERALRQSAEEYRELFEAESDAIFLIDNESGRLLQANQAACALYGYSHAELLTMRNVDLSAEPEHTQKVTRETAPVASQVVTIPVRWHKKKDGTVLPVEITGRFFVKDGRPVHIAAIRDITERRGAEDALAQERDLLTNLLTNIPDHIYFKDRLSRFVRVNDAHARWFGLSDPSEAVGKTDLDFFSEEHAQQACADDQRVMSTGQPVVGLEEKETWPDGHATWVSTTKVPIRDAAGQVVGLLGVSRDITEHKQAETRIGEQLDELRRWQEATVGREGRILELKKEVNDLLSLAGQPPRYPSAVKKDDVAGGGT